MNINGGKHLDAIDAAWVFRAALPPPPPHHHHRAEDLTPREIEVLRQLALGRSNKEIADALAIGDETVKTHVGNVLGKLQAENRAQAIVQGLKRGLLALEELD